MQLENHLLAIPRMPQECILSSRILWLVVSSYFVLACTKTRNTNPEHRNTSGAAWNTSGTARNTPEHLRNCPKHLRKSTVQSDTAWKTTGAMAFRCKISAPNLIASKTWRSSSERVCKNGDFIRNIKSENVATYAQICYIYLR